MYAKCYDDEDEVTPFRVYDYLKREGVLNFTKGIPTSMAMTSEQQWDKENAWPPVCTRFSLSMQINRKTK